MGDHVGFIHCKQTFQFKNLVFEKIIFCLWRVLALLYTGRFLFLT